MARVGRFLAALLTVLLPVLGIYLAYRLVQDGENFYTWMSAGGAWASVSALAYAGYQILQIRRVVENTKDEVASRASIAQISKARNTLWEAIDRLQGGQYGVAWMMLRDLKGMLDEIGSSLEVEAVHEGDSYRELVRRLGENIVLLGSTLYDEEPGFDHEPVGELLVEVEAILSRLELKAKYD